MPYISTFLNAGSTASPEKLAILQLQRDALVPVILKGANVASEDYVEGVVTNTRFGSFPHSTLSSQPWGSQILASKVDTGSKGKAMKRKRDANDQGDESRESTPVKMAITAGTGFAHLLQPTPESWTISLPHRTQVVYTPDYSYILQRLRVTPGSKVIEAGAGSGSFTHASVRAVFNSYDGTISQTTSKAGHVFSFEYHEPRVETLREELDNHGLSQLVTVTHRDVYEHGFLLGDTEKTSPKCNAVFLDLPAPWKALRNLTRRRLPSHIHKALSEPLGGDFQSTFSKADAAVCDATSAIGRDEEFTSPLDPSCPISVCCFIPCIEQVQSAVAALRLLGWVDIEMVEIAHRRMDVRRERVGFAEEGLRGTNAGPKDVEETMGRLLDVEGRFKAWGEQVKRRNEVATDQPVQNKDESGKDGESSAKQGRKTQKQQRQERNREVEKERKIYKEGVLVSRPESEIKSHTSYLVFAVLPIEWTEEDEVAALKRWGTGAKANDEQEKAKPGRNKADTVNAVVTEASEEGEEEEEERR